MFYFKTQPLQGPVFLSLSNFLVSIQTYFTTSHSSIWGGYNNKDTVYTRKYKNNRIFMMKDETNLCLRKGQTIILQTNPKRRVRSQSPYIGNTTYMRSNLSK